MPSPTPNASPREVVLAYIDALQARDFATANLIDARPDSDIGRFSRPLTPTNVEIISTHVGHGTATVLFTADYDHSDGSLTDGEEWGYALKRGTDRLWHITGAGVA